jgi:hypothetical protein
VPDCNAITLERAHFGEQLETSATLEKSIPSKGSQVFEKKKAGGDWHTLGKGLEESGWEAGLHWLWPLRPENRIWILFQMLWQDVFGVH